MKNLKTYIIFTIGSLILSFGNIMSMEKKSDIIGKNRTVWTTLYLTAAGALLGSTLQLMKADGFEKINYSPFVLASGYIFFKLCDIRNRNDARLFALNTFNKLPDKDDKCFICHKEFSLNCSYSSQRQDDEILLEEWVFLSSCCKQFMCKDCYNEWAKDNHQCAHCSQPMRGVKKVL